MKSLALLLGVTANSGIDKVIQLLGELKGKVQAELDGESKLMDEYTQWCDDDKIILELGVVAWRTTWHFSAPIQTRAWFPRFLCLQSRVSLLS